jgi:hypothetical protein
MRNLKYLLISFLIVSSLWACKKSSETPKIVVKSYYKVLFVGNSYTFYNDGVDFHLQKMLAADASSDSIIYSCQKIAKGSYTLEAQFSDQETLTKISSTKWNTVVLQEQSTRPINNPALFLEYATKLDLEIKKVNAKTVLYMTWAEKDQPGDIEALAASYLLVASQINANTAPVGRVWEYFQKSNPQIELFISDNKHPTLSGTYLNSCVFFYTLFGKNPMDNTYIPSGLNTENVTAIRKAVYDYMKLPK